MKTFKQMNAIELLTSFDNGQGKTNELPAISSLDNETLTYNGMTAQVTPAWQQAYILMQVNKDLKDRASDKQASLISAWNEGRLTMNHNTSIGTDTKASKKPLVGHVLTSESYYNNLFTIAASGELLQSIYRLATNVSESTNKADLLAKLGTIANSIVTVDQMQVYHTIEAKEAAIKTVVNKLKEAGMDAIRLLSETQLVGNVALASIGAVQACLEEVGYTEVNASFDPLTKTMLLMVDKVPTTA